MRENGAITNTQIQMGETDILVSKTDLGGRITFVNSAFIRISGYAEDELVGAPHNLVRHPHMPKEAFADLWACIKAGQPWEGLVKNRCKNGDYYWVRANVTPLVENGQITGYISIRTKPSDQQVAAAERVYQDFREGRAGDRAIQDGQVVRTDRAHRLWDWMHGLIGRISAMVALFSVVAVLGAGGGLYGMHDTQDALRNVVRDRVVPSSQLAQIQDGLDRDLRRVMAVALGHESREAALKELRAEQAVADQLWASFVANGRTAEEKALAEQFSAARSRFVHDGVEKALALTDEGQIRQFIAGTLVPLHTQAGGPIGQLFALQGTIAQAEYVEAQQDLTEHTLFAALSILLGLIAILILARHLVRGTLEPMERMGHHFQAIARGDFTREIPFERVADFRTINDNLRAMRAKLGYGTIEAREVAERAEAQLKTQMLTLTETLDGEVQETVGEISSQARRLSEGAEHLSKVAEDLRAMAVEVTNSIQTTSGNVQTVAGATEELEASSREITAQVTHSSSLADTARARADEASQRVASLTEASARIGNVVAMIQNIAGMTRMLALNATIEAARAGDAGKGFVVVAEEVKGLALQTEEGIAMVNAQAEEIGRTTREAVDTVEAVADAIRNIDQIASEVAASADEQRSATAEIMASAAQAASHTAAVADNVQAMMQGVDSTGDTARRVNELSAMVNRDIAALQRRLYVILRTSYGGDRRMEPRIPTDVAFRAQFGGDSFNGVTADLSPHGALLVPSGKHSPVAKSGTVDLDGVGPLEARIVSESVGGLHVQLVNMTQSRQTALAARIEKAQDSELPFRTLVDGVAQSAAQALEQALAQNKISAADLFDTEYNPIVGTNPVQVMAKHTELVEGLFRSLIEQPLDRDPRIVYCCITDRNGYIATHNLKYSHPQKPGDVVWNTANSRNRRIFDDRTGIMAARTQKPLTQTYARDMGGGTFVLLKELDAPISAQGRHWGTVRMALKLG